MYYIKGIHLVYITHKIHQKLDDQSKLLSIIYVQFFINKCMIKFYESVDYSKKH